MSKSKKTIKNDLIRSNVNKGVNKEAEKKSGVLQTILTLIQKKEQSFDSLLKGLKRAFPERDVTSMEKTIKAQLGATSRPTRMERERGIELKIEIRTIKDKPVRFFSFVGEMDWSEVENESEE